MRLRHQQANEVVDIESFNQTQAEVVFDLSILYETIIEQLRTLIGRFHVGHSIYNSESRKLDRLINRLDESLITIKNADDHFQGFIERFDTLDKTNQTLTTNGMVDVDEGAITIPQSAAATRRVAAQHLWNAESWDVRVTSGGPTSVNSSMIGAGFGKAFADTISAWRHRIVASTPGSLQAEFEFPIAGPADEEKEVEVSRIQLVPHADFPFRVSFFKSVDGVNYTTIPGLEGSYQLDKQSKTYNFDFSTEVIQFLKIKVTKDNEDRQISENEFEYIFGFFSIALFTVGRLANAVYVSKPFETKKPIGKVAMSSQAHTPDGADTRYFVGLADSYGDLTGSWHPITPENSIRNDPLGPKVVKFGESDVESFEYLAPTTGYLKETYKGNSLYVVNPEQSVSGDYLFGTATLSRGEGGWYRDKNPVRETEQAANVYLDFTSSNRQPLYVLESDTVTLEGSGQSYARVELSYAPYYDTTLGHELVPQPGTDPRFDQSPDYAIYEAKWLTKDTSRSQSFTGVTAMFIDLDSDGPVDLDTLTVTVTEATDATGAATSMNRQLRQEIDYTIEGNRISAVQDNIQRGKKVIYNSWWAQKIEDDYNLDFLITYRPDTDLTQRVIGINGKIVTIDARFATIGREDNVLILYRRKVEPPAKVLVETFRGKTAFGNSEDVYIEGRDFTIDPNSGTIYRIPTGNIPSNGVMYADFYYEKPTFPVQTFSTWVLVGRSDLPEISLSKLSLDKENGESFILNSRKGFVDLTEIGKIPELAAGWHQFIVKSRAPSVSNAAITQVIKLVDNANAVVFETRGKYFDKMTSLRNQMRQATLDFLKKGVLPANHGFFAIDTSGNVIINFLQGTTDEVYAKKYNPTSGTITDRQERFALSYTVRTRTSPSNLLLVKIELVRRPSSDGGITPKVEEYILRVSP